MFLFWQPHWYEGVTVLLPGKVSGAPYTLTNSGTNSVSYIRSVHSWENGLLNLRLHLPDKV
jgi:hypothetical protein